MSERTITPNPMGLPETTGSFDAGDAIVIRWNVPEGCPYSMIAISQRVTSSDLTLGYNGEEKRTLTSASFVEMPPTPGAKVATLTADGYVWDVAVRVKVKRG